MRIWPLFLLLAACGPTPEAARAEKLAKLDALRNETLADLHRSKADCEADRIEFPDVPELYRACITGHAAIEESARETLASVEKREAEIRNGKP